MKGGAYRSVRMTSRWYQSKIIRFIISCFFWFYILPELYLESQTNQNASYIDNSTPKQNYSTNIINEPMDPHPNTNTTILKLDLYSIQSSSNSHLCLLLTDRYTLSNSETLQIIKVLKARKVICDGHIPLELNTY